MADSCKIDRFTALWNSCYPLPSRPAFGRSVSSFAAKIGRYRHFLHSSCTAYFQSIFYKEINKMAAYQYVYVMKGLSKIYPGGKKTLEDIWLSFLPGAKIGVIGPNGAGKSTLMRIMAGLDKEFGGEAWAAEGARVGYLPQEPELDPKKDVTGNIMEALKETQALLERFEAVSARFAEELSDDEMNTLIAEQGELQEKIDAANAWELDRTVEIAMDAL